MIAGRGKSQTAFRLAYPLTPESTAALARYPAIANAVQIPSTGRSELEIVRFLRKAEDSDIDRFLVFINTWLPEFDADLVKQRDPFQFRRLLADLYLLAHLRSRLGGGVRRPILPRGGQRGPDVEVNWHEKLVKLEVYTPLDFAGLALLQEHVIALFEYADVARGFVVDVAVESLDESVESVWYAYELPDETVASQWLRDLGDRVEDWLGRPGLAVGDEFTSAGPAPATRICARARSVFDDPAARRVIVSFPTRSSDTKLFFECGAAQDTAKLTWAKKLAGKMRHAQAGPPLDGVLRILVVNLAASDTGWPDFIARPKIAERIAETVRILAAEIDGPPAYDAVLPAWLSITSHFGIPVLLDPSKRTAVESFIAAGALDLPYVGNVPDQQADIEAVLDDS